MTSAEPAGDSAKSDAEKEEEFLNNSVWLQGIGVFAAPSVLHASSAHLPCVFPLAPELHPIKVTVTNHTDLRITLDDAVRGVSCLSLRVFAQNFACNAASRTCACDTPRRS